MHAKRATAAGGAEAAQAGEGQEGVQQGADVRGRRARLPVASPRSGAVRQGDSCGARGELHPSFKLVSDPAAILWTWKTSNRHFSSDEHLGAAIDVHRVGGKTQVTAFGVCPAPW